MNNGDLIEELREENKKCYKKCNGACLQVKNNKCACRDAIIVYELEEIHEYRSIGTVEECREAMEKKNAKKPIDAKVRKVLGYYQCPTCGGLLTKNKRFCEDCGQAISWEESEEQ